MFAISPMPSTFTTSMLRKKLHWWLQEQPRLESSTPRLRPRCPSSSVVHGQTDRSNHEDTWRHRNAHYARGRDLHCFGYAATSDAAGCKGTCGNMLFETMISRPLDLSAKGVMHPLHHVISLGKPTTSVNSPADVMTSCMFSLCLSETC